MKRHESARRVVVEYFNSLEVCILTLISWKCHESPWMGYFSLQYLPGGLNSTAM
jgi:hypothetical protein